MELTPDNRAAVERLIMTTGIDFGTAVQVFCACEMNEAVAEGCLFSMRL
jgi:hypothetical protein